MFLSLSQFVHEIFKLFSTFLSLKNGHRFLDEFCIYLYIIHNCVDDDDVRIYAPTN